MTKMTRRRFLTHTAAAGTIASVAGFTPTQTTSAAPAVKGTPNADKLGWRLGFSAYTYRGLTLFEALERIAEVGLRYTELFSWQKLSPQHPEAQTGPGLAKVLRRDLKKKAADCGVKMIGCYTTLNSADGAKEFFEFAADMGVEMIVAEPAEELLDAVERLTDEYHVDLAMHNHARPSHYWNPAIGLEALEGRSQRMGFCCDTGHWCRSGLEPAEMVRKIGPRLKSFHLKDLDQFGVTQAEDVVWGRGKGRIAEILAEVRRQDLKPYFGIEWEKTTDSEPSLHAESIAFFEETAGKLAAS